MSNKEEWHEGSSEIIVDDAEDRMLSTSFITELLSSAEDSASVIDGTRTGSQKHYPPSYVTTDARSATSEMTYPPPEIRTPQPDFGPHRTSPSQPQYPNYSQASRPVPSFLTLDPDTRSVAGSIGTFDGNDLQGGSVIRTASMTRKLGARGASVVGVAPATLQKVSLSTRGSPSNNASVSSHEGKRHDSTHSTFVPSDEAAGQRLTIPDFHIPTTAFYSPAQQSSIDMRPNSRTQTTKRQSAMSLMSSFIPRFSAIPSGTRRESRSIPQAVGGWFKSKPLPRLPVHTNMTIAVEAEHRKADEALPLPELVDRADTLSGMLEKGRYPHTSIISMPIPNRAATPCIVTPWEAFPGDDRKDNGIIGDSPGTLTQSWKGKSGDASVQDQWPVLDNHNMKRVLVTRRQMIAIGLLLMLLLGLIIGLSVGLTLKTKHNLPDCPGNFTGNACNLGK